MLKERYGLTDDSGNITVITVDEILDMYEIKGLTLEELQEKYVDTVDEYEDKLNEGNYKYEELMSNYSSLQESIEELTLQMEEKEYINPNTDSFNSNFWILLIVAIIISFFIGKYLGKRAS